MVRSASVIGSLLLGLSCLAQAGSNDPNFNIWGNGVSSGGHVNKVLPLPDGRLVIAGYFTDYDGTSRSHIALLHADGTLDESFDPGSGFNAQVNDVLMREDHKLVAVGMFTSYNGVPAPHVAVIDQSGELDASFDPQIGGVTNITCVARMADGRLVVGAGPDCGSFSGAAGDKLARLNTDGTLDTTFHQGIGYIDDINALLPLPDGQVVVGGVFSYQLNGFTRVGIAQLLPDGGLDPAFFPTENANVVFALARQPDGRILLGRSNGVQRLQQNGAVDPSFQVTNGGFSGGWDPWVYSIAVQNDGAIVVGGRFLSVSGMQRPRVARLLSDGSVDTTFDPITGFDDEVWSVTCLPDGRTLVGGYFTSISSMARFGLARLNGSDGASGVNTGAQDHAIGATQVYPNPSSGLFQVMHIPADAMALQITGPDGRIVWQAAATSTVLDRTVDLQDRPAGIYLLHVHTSHGEAVARLVKE